MAVLSVHGLGMKFLSFDIESIDGCFAEGNICEFGYVVADENFNILKQENLMIKPSVLPKKLNRHMPLTYSVSDYAKAPEFASVYNVIYNLLNAEDTLVIGHAVHNDVFCVNSACAKNNLELPSYKYLDTQILFAIYKSQSSVLSLDKIAEEIGIEFVHHRADEDARLSLMTLEYVCRKTGMALDSLLDCYNVEIGINNRGEVTPCRSVYVFDGTPCIASNNSKRKLLQAFIDDINKKRPVYSGRFVGKKFHLSKKMSINDIDLSRRIIKAMCDEGARYIGFPEGANIIVGHSEDYKTKMKAEFMDMHELLRQIELPEIEFNDIETLQKYNAEQKLIKRNINKTNHRSKG